MFQEFLLNCRQIIWLLNWFHVNFFKETINNILGITCRNLFWFHFFLVIAFLKQEQKKRKVNSWTLLKHMIMSWKLAELFRVVCLWGTCQKSLFNIHFTIEWNLWIYFHWLILILTWKIAFRTIAPKVINPWTTAPQTIP